jgi:hypothetical protein
MADFRTDWDFLQAAVPELQQYLLSNDLFWPLRLPRTAINQRQAPQLSIGSLALSQARLAGQALTAEEQSRLAELAAGVEQVRQEWRANWARKAAQERAARLNLWQQYLRELRSEPRVQAAYYANEVRQRAVLSLLADELNDGVPPGEQEQLNMLDQITRGLTRTGPFVWEPGLEPSFPPETFWFLYVTLQK